MTDATPEPPQALAPAQEAENFSNMLNEYAAKFDTLCQERHNAGAAEYGHFTFLENDVLRMMMEELADTSNYCRMQAIKLLMLQEVLEEQLGEKLTGQVSKDGDIQFGAQAFKGTKDVGWN